MADHSYRQEPPDRVEEARRWLETMRRTLNQAGAPLVPVLPLDEPCRECDASMAECIAFQNDEDAHCCPTCQSEKEATHSGEVIVRSELL